MALAVLGALTAISIFKYTGICTLQAITVNGALVEKWDKNNSLEKDKSILGQPLESFEESSFADEKTLKLDYRYSWPHTLIVRVNSISPECLLLDKNSSTLFGLDKSGRVLPLQNELVDWERPVITGVGGARLYQALADVRVRKVLKALDQVRRDRVNFYRLIEEIDFSSQEDVEVSVAGQGHRIRLRAEYFYEDINRYLDFVARFRPQLEGIKVIDLRQDGQIVTKGKKA